MSTLPAFLDAFVAALQLRGGLAGVRVFGCPVVPEDLGEEGIELAEEVSVDTSRDSMNSEREDYTVNGSVLVLAPMVRGASPQSTINATAKVARDRCNAIVAEVADELLTDCTVGGVVVDAQLDGITFHQGMAPEGQMGRACWCEFSVKVWAGDDL